MGLDVYTGSLTRYYTRDWLTIIQQAGLRDGHQVEIVFADDQTENHATDPGDVAQIIADWQRDLADALGVSETWNDQADLPYWTDKPDWAGYEALSLIAAADERPDLLPKTRKRLFGRKAVADPLAEFRDNGYATAITAPQLYPSLLLGAEWWLPLPLSGVIQASRPNGEVALMGSVDGLVEELSLLARRLGLSGDDLASFRESGPTADQDVAREGRFGLAVFLEIALEAQRHRLPMVLDY